MLCDPAQNKHWMSTIHLLHVNYQDYVPQSRHARPALLRETRQRPPNDLDTFASGRQLLVLTRTVIILTEALVVFPTYHFAVGCL